MIFAIAASLITAALLYALFFEDWDEFTQCVKSCLTPDIISLFRGRHWEDWWAESKIILWLLISGLAGMLVYINFGRP
ncbi:MAG: hypothetical protein Q3966_07930, partial [Neisseria sp.]|nr:hypothetical protein [Neisseria sp.]